MAKFLFILLMSLFSINSHSMDENSPWKERKNWICKKTLGWVKPLSARQGKEVSTTPRVTENVLLNKAKEKAIDLTLDYMAYRKGLPKYLKRTQYLQQEDRFLEYNNFGEMGLAELGISVRYNAEKLTGLNTGRPLLVVANHPLGIADGLSLQHIISRARPENRALLLLARWIEGLLPEAIVGHIKGWGTAYPVEINLPDKTDPLYKEKMAEVEKFNSPWRRKYIRSLKAKKDALIIFPAGHVAPINKEDGAFPENVYDAPGSWESSVISLARLGKADIVFAHIASVNNKAFYEKRKRFGGGDKERVIWFFGEAIAKKGKAIDVFLSEPMNLDRIYSDLSKKYNLSESELREKPELTMELMRQYNRSLATEFPQELDVLDSPQKIEEKNSN